MNSYAKTIQFYFYSFLFYLSNFIAKKIRNVYLISADKIDTCTELCNYFKFEVDTVSKRSHILTAVKGHARSLKQFESKEIENANVLKLYDKLRPHPIKNQLKKSVSVERSKRSLYKKY